MIRKLALIPPSMLVIIGVMLASAPASQAFGASGMADFVKAPTSQSLRAQASFNRHRARLVARVEARRAEARKDRRAHERAADIAAAQAAAAAAAATPSPTPAAPAASGGSYGAPPGSFQACVIARESGGDPTIVNASSGAGGLYQFLPSTWAGLGLGYPGGAQTAPPSVQTEGFFKLYAEAGAAPWSSDGC